MAKITIHIQGSPEGLSGNDFKIKKDNANMKNVLPVKEPDGNFVYDDLTRGNYIISCTRKPAPTQSEERVEIENEEERKGITFNFEQSLSQILRTDSATTARAQTVNVDQDEEKSFNVRLTPSIGGSSDDQSLWRLIIGNEVNDFAEYQQFMNAIMNCELGVPGQKQHYTTPAEKDVDKKRLPFNSTEAYSLLKYATEKFVKYKYSISDAALGNEKLNKYLGDDNILPYYNLIELKLPEFVTKTVNNCGYLKLNTNALLLELIWNYWHEEGMVNQTVAALAKRFQNVKNGYIDPLANFELDPLRPLNNILWGYIQDRQHRLTPARRNYEYEHHYGLRLASTPVDFNPADRRYKFLQSFHRLIREATEYFIQSDNTTIRPDGFKLLNALRDTHRIISEGAHNQFGDLPVVARIETLIEQWIIARPEVREFLGGRIMVPYEEPWMDRVDSMKALQGWDNTSITFYRDLAVNGEKIILGVRLGDWTHVTKRDNATNWADSFRDSIQRYIHSYYTVTGIDLAAQNVNINSQEKFLLPGILIQNKLMLERQKRVLRR